MFFALITAEWGRWDFKQDFISQFCCSLIEARADNFSDLLANFIFFGGAKHAAIVINADDGTLG